MQKNKLAIEPSKSDHIRKQPGGLYERFMKGSGVDVGYSGHRSDTVPVNGALGVDLGMKGYDGINLPVPDNSLDYVFSSHMLEHVKTDDLNKVLQAWYKALKVGGYMVIVVPHKYLYEKRNQRPSRYNHGHHRFYTPGSLLNEIDLALPINGWRLRHCIDNDRDFDYSLGPDKHSSGCYEIECVIEKIKIPDWELA